MILSVTGGENFGGPWQITDGTGGSIEHFNGLLAVRQTAAVHRQIEELLAALRRSAAERGWDGTAAGEPAAAAPEGGESVVLVVGPDGIRSINGTVADRPDEYRQALILLGKEKPSCPIIVRAEKSVPARAVQEVVQFLAEVGLTRVSLRVDAAPDAVSK